MSLIQVSVSEQQIQLHIIQLAHPVTKLSTRSSRNLQECLHPNPLTFQQTSQEQGSSPRCFLKLFTGLVPVLTLMGLACNMPPAQSYPPWPILGALTQSPIPWRSPIHPNCNVGFLIQPTAPEGKEKPRASGQYRPCAGPSLWLEAPARGWAAFKYLSRKRKISAKHHKERFC